MLKLNYNTNGEILQDKKRNGKLRPWKPKKESNIVLSSSYWRLGYEKYAYKVRWCASYLKFKTEVEALIKHLNSARFCQLPLCPMCQWRKSMKKATDVSMVLDECQRPEKFFDKRLNRYLELVPIFLTLTVKTCSVYDFADELDKLLVAWKSLMNHRDFRRAVRGFFRAIEFTYDRDKKITEKKFKKNPKYYAGLGLSVGDDNPNYDKFHLHIHAVMLVDQKSYFKGDDYIDQRNYRALWQSALCVSYDPWVDIRPFKGNSAAEKRKSVNEVAKYTMKDSEILSLRDNKKIDELVKVLTDALYRRTLYSYGGVMRKVAGEILKDRPEDDLINTGDDTIREDVATFFESYFWSFSRSNYLRVLDESC